MPVTVLHYVGYADDHSGVVSVVRAVAAAGRFDCVLGVNPGCVQHREPPLAALELPAIAAETISPATWWRARTVARAAQRWLAAERTRVFHGHSRAGLLTALWLQCWGERRVVATVHSFGRQRWFYRWAAGRLRERLFWLSPAMKRYYGAGGDDWNGCLPNALARAPQPRGAGRRMDRLVVGGAGMLVPWKGWDLVLEALARLPAAVRERVEFRHIGASDGSAASRAHAAALQERMRALGLERQVRWLGWQSASEAWLRTLDCALVASRREPFSMVALEALFAGVPVIAADDGGPRDFVREGESGWFFRSGDAADLARVLERLATTDALERVRIDPEGLRRFESGAAAERWREVYARVLAEA